MWTSGSGISVSGIITITGIWDEGIYWNGTSNPPPYGHTPCCREMSWLLRTQAIRRPQPLQGWDFRVLDDGSFCLWRQDRV